MIKSIVPATYQKRWYTDTPDINLAITIFCAGCGPADSIVLTGELHHQLERQANWINIRYFAFLLTVLNICSIKYPITDYRPRSDQLADTLSGPYYLPPPAYVRTKAMVHFCVSRRSKPARMGPDGKQGYRRKMERIE